MSIHRELLSNVHLEVYIKRIHEQYDRTINVFCTITRFRVSLSPLGSYKTNSIFF